MATTLAIKYAQEAERLGAQGILLLPHYLTEASQEGLIAHVQAVCKSVKFGGGLQPWRLPPDARQQVLADTCPNLIGFKDGFGDIEKFVSIRQTLGDRFAYLGGLPTAELFAGAYKAMGCPCTRRPCSISSPRQRWSSTTPMLPTTPKPANRLIRDFFIPYIALRNQGEGYAVSIVKAGATISGHSAGPVRPPCRT